MLEAVTQFQGLAGAMKAMGQQFTADQEQTLALMDILGPLLSNAAPTLIASVAGSPKYRFVLELNPEHLIDQIENLEGEATVFGTVERITTRGEFVTVSDLVKNLEPFLPNRAARRRRTTAQQNQGDDFIDDQELRIGHPAGILAPVAIYR